MNETLSSVIRNGFSTYRHNLNLSLPFLLPILLGLMTLLPSMAILVIVSSPGSEMLMPFGFLILFLAIFLGYVFAVAGVVGMAKEATLEEKTSLKTMWLEGKLHYIQLLFAEAIIFVILIMGIVLLFVPLEIMGISGSVGLAVMLLVTIFFLLLFAIALSNVVAVSVVIDDLKAGKAICEGLRFIRSNKRDSFLMSFFYLMVLTAFELAVGIVIVATSTIFGFGEQFFSESLQWADILSIPINIIELVVIYPLFVVLWTRLYMARTGKLSEVEPIKLPSLISPDLEEP